VKNLAKVLGVFGLAAMTFFSCDQPNETGTTDSVSENSEVVPGDIKIAYIQTDSVITQFDFYKKRSEEITDKGKKFESELSSRAKGFEQEVTNFQQTASSMTPNQARAKEEDLMKKERNLMTYRDNLMQELSADESKLYSEVYDQIQEFLVGYAQEKDLDMILSHTRGGAVWYSKKSLDVTDDVIQELNKRYASNPTKTDTIK
jgi:outer membrane protein